MALNNSNSQQVNVVSAVELNLQEKRQLELLVRQKFGPGCIFKYSLNQSLLGGFVVTYNDWMFDASLANQLADLKERLL